MFISAVVILAFGLCFLIIKFTCVVGLCMCLGISPIGSNTMVIPLLPWYLITQLWPPFIQFQGLKFRNTASFHTDNTCINLRMKEVIVFQQFIWNTECWPCIINIKWKGVSEFQQVSCNSEWTVCFCYQLFLIYCDAWRTLFSIWLHTHVVFIYL